MKRLSVAAFAALALVAGACGDSEPEVTATSDPTDGASATEAPTGAEMTDAMEHDRTAGEVEALVGVPDDVTIDNSEQAEDGTWLFLGTYANNPTAAESSMTDAGWEHLMTRPGSFNMSFRMELSMEAEDANGEETACAAIRADTEFRWGAAIVFVAAGTDCDTWAVDYFPTLEARLDF